MTNNVPLKYDYESVQLTYKHGDDWLPLKVSSINYQANYSPDDNNTLIIGSETLTLGLSGYGNRPIKEPLTLVRLAYVHNGKSYPVGSGEFKLDSYRRSYSTDAKSASYGELFVTHATCTAVAAYASAVDAQVTYAKTRPTGEKAVDFIRSVGVRITNWGS